MAFAAGAASAQHTDEFTQSLSYAEYLKGADIRASRLVGERIRNAEGDTIGEIEEILIPSAQQDEMFVIVRGAARGGARVHVRSPR